MTKTELSSYITEQYAAHPDFPWMKHPSYAVFRHNDKKWFALVIDVPKEKLGVQGDGYLDIVNLKCDPIMIGSLLLEPGSFPAYHMNRENWISVALDGSVPEEKLKMLIDISYDLTDTLKKKNRHR